MLEIVAAPRLILGQLHKLPAELNDHLREFLQNYEGTSDKTLRYAAALVKGDDEQKEEIVVYLSGQIECGTGGCALFILRPDGSSFKRIGRVTTVWLPIRLLRTETNGRPDIGAFSQWGVGDQGQELALKFDGSKYKKTGITTGGASGHILIPKEDIGISLFGH